MGNPEPSVIIPVEAPQQEPEANVNPSDPVAPTTPVVDTVAGGEPTE